MHGPQLQIVILRAADGTWSAQLADYCTLGAEGFPTATGAVNALVARVENGPGWPGLWRDVEARELAYSDSVWRLEEVCAAGPTAGDAAWGQGPAENDVRPEEVWCPECGRDLPPGGQTYCSERCLELAAWDPNCCRWCGRQDCPYVRAGADCPTLLRLQEEAEEDAA